MNELAKSRHTSWIFKPHFRLIKIKIQMVFSKSKFTGFASPFSLNYWTDTVGSLCCVRPPDFLSTEETSFQTPCSRSRLPVLTNKTGAEGDMSPPAEAVTAPAWPPSLVAQSWQIWSKFVEMTEPQIKAAWITELPGKAAWRDPWALCPQGQVHQHTEAITENRTLYAGLNVLLLMFWNSE